MAKRNKFDVDERLERAFNFTHLKRIGVYIKKYAWQMFFSLFISILASVAVLYGPKISERVLDEVVPQGNYALLLKLAILYSVLVLVSILLRTWRTVIMAHVSQGLIYDIRKDLFAHLQKLPFSYYDSRPAGKILVRVINYVNSVSDILTNGVINSIIEIINIIIIVIFMYATEPTLATIIIAGLPLFILFVWLLKPLQRRAWQEASNKNSNYTAYLAENIDGVRITQLFTREEKNVNTMNGLIEDQRKAGVKAIAIGYTVMFSSEIVTQIVFTVMYIAGVYWTGGEMVSFGIILAMGQYLKRFWAPITSLSNIYNNFINNIAYLERIFEVMDEPVVIDDAPDAVALPDVTGAVDFKNVTFAYEEGVNILEDISFHVRPGESIALVGPTGAGKTTVVNVLSRFYNLNSGKISLQGSDGKDYDISKVTIHSLRGKMGVMLQDSFIFSGSIMENIRYGRLDATDEECIAAAKAVHAHEFITQMPRGYNAVVNERGGGLSGGQKQLIAFARTLLSDPEILILDEATSSIDTKTEKVLQSAIDELLKGRTSFIIAHRLSTIKNCDRIFYIGEKSVLEAGSHEELMAKKGRYYDLYTSQQNKE